MNRAAVGMVSSHVRPARAAPAGAPDRGHRGHAGVHCAADRGAAALGPTGGGGPLRRGPAEQPGRRAPGAGRGHQGGHLAGQHRRAVDRAWRGRGRAGRPAALEAGLLPGGHRGGRAGARPGPQVAGRPAPPGGRAPGRARHREQLPQRALARLDRLLRRAAAGLPARHPAGLAAHRAALRHRRAHRGHRDQPDPARRALPVRRGRRLGPRPDLARYHRARVRPPPFS
jgi:hypothetical protein